MWTRPIVAISFLAVLACRPALAEDQPRTQTDDLRGEIRELQKAVERLANRLEAMERRLSQIEKPAFIIERPGVLRFPADIERAMLLEERTSPARKVWDFEEMRKATDFGMLKPLLQGLDGGIPSIEPPRDLPAIEPAKPAP